MTFWIFVAISGIIISLAGILTVYRRYKRHQVSARFFIALIVGFFSFVSYAVMDAFKPGLTAGVWGLLILAPAFLGILVFIQESRMKSINFVMDR